MSELRELVKSFRLRAKLDEELRGESVDKVDRLMYAFRASAWLEAASELEDVIANVMPLPLPDEEEEEEEEEGEPFVVTDIEADYANHQLSSRYPHEVVCLMGTSGYSYPKWLKAEILARRKFGRKEGN